MTGPLQTTLQTSAALGGIGLHSGERCEVILHPADEGAGIVFCTPSGDIRALAENVATTNRGTSLREGDAEVHTAEHLLSALSGMGVDNVRIQVDGPEIPIGDGSALPFVELIEQAGIRVQSADAQFTSVRVPVWASDADRLVLAVPESGYRASALITYDHPMIGEQSVSFFISPDVFRREIAPARTFCTAREIEWILSRGLGKGGTAGNVIVVEERGYSTPLRFSDELVRHKVLDLIGDLALTGGRLCAHVFAVRAGHALHAALARRIRKF